MIDYYDGTKLLSMKDINSHSPELILCVGNRTSGKTTFFNRLLVNRFFKKREKFVLLYRYKYELDDIPEKFFKDISGLFFPGYIMNSKKRAKGIYTELFIRKRPLDEDDKELGTSCGYGIPINSADQIKKMSHVFSDSCSVLFDEFQSENNDYCPNELHKFISIHTSIARGKGKQYRFVPVYMLSNSVSLINPYFVELGIAERLRRNTKFMRGDGFVLEQSFNESASISQKESGFNRAFSKNDYVAYSSENIYLNDNLSFIERPSGVGRYLATLKYKNAEFAIREYASDGILYCDNRPDHSFKYKIAVTMEDHNINYVMLKRNDLFISNMRYFFEKGCFRFKDLSAKEAVLKTISY